MKLKRAKQVILAHSEAVRLLTEHQRVGTIDTIRAAKIRVEKAEVELSEARAVIADYESSKQAKSRRLLAHSRVIERARAMNVPGNLQLFADAVVAAASDAEIEALLGRIARVDNTLIVDGHSAEERMEATLAAYRLEAQAMTRRPRHLNTLELEAAQTAAKSLTVKKSASMGTTESTMEPSSPTNDFILPPLPQYQKLKSDHIVKRKWR